MPVVKLTNYELFLAAQVGVRRRIASLKRSQTNKVQNADFGWHVDIEAAAAEMALAKALGIFWDGSVNTFKHPDVGPLQVRHTQHPGGSLIIRPDDKEDEIYVLVTGASPTFHLRGWCAGSEGKQPAFLKDPNGAYPAYFIPQHALHPITRLHQTLPLPPHHARRNAPLPDPELRRLLTPPPLTIP